MPIRGRAGLAAATLAAGVALAAMAAITPVATVADFSWGTGAPVGDPTPTVASSFDSPSPDPAASPMDSSWGT